MEFLDFIWYLIKIIASATLLVALCNIFMSLVNLVIDTQRERKQNQMIHQAIENAIKNNDFEVVDARKIKKKK